MVSVALQAIGAIAIGMAVLFRCRAHVDVNVAGVVAWAQWEMQQRGGVEVAGEVNKGISQMYDWKVDESKDGEWGTKV